MDTTKQIYLEDDLSVGTHLTTSKILSKRLKSIYKLKTGDYINLFNGRDGLFQVEIKNDKCTCLFVKSILKPKKAIEDAVLFVSFSEQDSIDTIFRHATELGATEIIPLITDRSTIDTLDVEHIQKILIESAEQSKHLNIPKLHAISHMEMAIKKFNHHIYWCAEHVGGKWGEHTTISGQAILVGPEEGFSSRERTWLNACTNVSPVGLGCHILQTDTAVCAALSRFFDHF